jgi:hypothetical protein
MKQGTLFFFLDNYNDAQEEAQDKLLMALTCFWLFFQTEILLVPQWSFGGSGKVVWIWPIY